MVFLSLTVFLNGITYSWGFGGGAIEIMPKIFKIKAMPCGCCSEKEGEGGCWMTWSVRD